MMKRVIGQGGTGFILVILVFCAVNALGQEKEFPVRPINLYVGFSPGGGVALTSQIISEGMKKYLKQPVFVNFKPGAAQAIAAEFVKNSKPDGYTLFCTDFEPLIAKVVIDGPMLKFRLEDFESLGAGPYIVNVLAVNAESPWKTVEDFIAEAKKSPGKLNVGHAGHGTHAHLKEVLFCMKNGIVVNQIPHAGGGPIIPALLGKHIDAGISSLPSFAAHVMPGGGLRVLVVFDQRRNANLPDVPTAIEKGIDITAIDQFGLQAPKGLPKSVKDILVETYKKTIEDPEVISGMKKLVGVGINYLTQEEIDRRIQENYKLFQDIWKTTGLKK